jgi:hypothetical protein
VIGAGKERERARAHEVISDVGRSSTKLGCIAGADPRCESEVPIIREFLAY